MESSADFPGGAADPLMVFSKTSPTPRNSGAQNALPNIIRAMNRAARFRPPFKQYAEKLAKEWLYGYAAIGGENALYLREVNTERSTQTLLTPNNGQKKGIYDEWFYGKGKFDNNQEQKHDDLGF